MKVLRLLLFAAFYGMLAPAVLAQPAAKPPADPTVAAVEKSLAELGARALPDAERTALKAVLDETLGHLKAAAENESRLRQLRQTLDEAPARIADARSELERLKAGAGAAAARSDAGRDLAELEKRFEERSARLGDLQRELTEANSQVIAAQTRPERGSAESVAAEARAKAIADALRSGREGNRALTPERRDLLAAEALALESGARLLRQELAGNSVLLELGHARRDLLTERIVRQEQEIQALQQLVGERRRAQSEQAVAKLSPEAAPTTQDGLLARETALNRKLSEYLLSATDRLNELTRRNLDARRQLDALKRVELVLEEQISVLQGSLLLTKILYEQRRALPKLQTDDKLADQLADLRLYQFEIGRYRSELDDPAALVERLLAEHPGEPASEALRRDLQALLSTRAELLQRLSRELDALISVSFELQRNQNALRSTSDGLRATLDEQMFWVPSNRRLDLDWLAAMPGMLDRQLTAIPWRSIATDVRSAFADRPILLLTLLVPIAGFWWRRAALVRRLEALHRDVGNVRTDSQWCTPQAILLNLLRALPVALPLAIAGLVLAIDGRGRNDDVGAALIEMALVWLVFYTVYRMLASGGVAERHFGFPSARAAHQRTKVRSLGLVAMLLAAVVTIAGQQPAALADDVIGVFVVLGCYGLMAWQSVGLIRGAADDRVPGFRLLTLVVFRLMPLALIAAVWLGYYYTALKLTGRLIDTILVLIVWRVVEAAAVRSLAVAARRLAFQRALARRQTAPRDPAARENAEALEIIEEPVLDIEQVNRQSLRLLRLGLLGATLFVLYWVWADLLSVAAYLDTVTLYEYGGSGAGAMMPISLLDLFSALAIAVVSLVLARNLPGLLEVLVLSRMNLGQGNAYAATTLLSYLIVGIGAISALSTLGVSWDKLQWLVAALSVGLGFGLQEIFANFVSGLIILFEKPVRIGDVVTIGNLSGTVSRIRIRATTIIDFDRKEIIIPNKTFVTDQLVNWSLSDTVTRVTVKIGVAYGSDLDLVRKLLLQIADENQRVLKEPAPMVVFLSFGASTLDHELRIHVPELIDRNAAIDEINRRIDQVFREHGIEIAYNQMDVHLHRPPVSDRPPVNRRTPPA
jgi:potassium efflux system protein